MTINPNIKLIIGLGNPGTAYRHTYHNMGFLAVDYLSQKMSLKWSVNKKYRFEAAELPNLILLKPLTFMNESGRAVSKITKMYPVLSEEILVIHDDSDLEIGSYKISFGRGSAGHHGIESIIQSLKTKNFWRFRIGIRSKLATKNFSGRIKAEKFVLGKMSESHQKTFYLIFGKLEGAIIKLITKE